MSPSGVYVHGSVLQMSEELPKVTIGAPPHDRITLVFESPALNVSASGRVVGFYAVADDLCILDSRPDQPPGRQLPCL